MQVQPGSLARRCVVGMTRGQDVVRLAYAMPPSDDDGPHDLPADAPSNALGESKLLFYSNLYSLYKENEMHRWLICIPLIGLLTACASTNWERSFYEGMRQGADNAAQQPGARAVPQTTPSMPYDRYEREREKLRSNGSSIEPIHSEAAASAAAR